MSTQSSSPPLFPLAHSLEWSAAPLVFHHSQSQCSISWRLTFQMGTLFRAAVGDMLMMTTDRPPCLCQFIYIYLRIYIYIYIHIYVQSLADFWARVRHSVRCPLAVMYTFYVSLFATSTSTSTSFFSWKLLVLLLFCSAPLCFYYFQV